MTKRHRYTLSALLRYAMLLCLLLSIGTSWGQARVAQKSYKDIAPTPVPQNVKVLSETKDKNGNLIRTIQYTLNGKKVTEIQKMPGNVSIRVPINPDTMNKDSVLVLVNKSQYRLEVYYRRKIIRSYKAVFGPKPLENKCLAGDRCTPEGWFTIKTKNPSSKYNKFMLLNYPNDSSIARFNKLKETGKIPKTAQMGGDVGIHGIWKGGDDMIDMGVNWTDGCVAIKNKDVDDLYTLIGVGTRVFIRK